jgi:hypothetical protein
MHFFVSSSIAKACPCALLVSTPVSYVAGLAALASSGVLVKVRNTCISDDDFSTYDILLHDFLLVVCSFVDLGRSNARSTRKYKADLL